jgi:acyl-CoA thioesterase I
MTLRKVAAVTVFFLSLASAAEKPLSAVKAELLKKWPSNRTVNIVFHGHSVPAGYHKTPEVKPFESYPHLVNLGLAATHPFAVINVIKSCIGGESSPAGASRFESDALSHRPDIVLIDYALNDDRKPIKQVKDSWLAMIRSAKKAKVPVVLLTPTGNSGVNIKDHAQPLAICAEMIRRLSAEEQVILADVSAAWQAELAKGTPEGELLSQPNHPNLRGHQLAADVILKALTDAGL